MMTLDYEELKDLTIEELEDKILRAYEYHSDIQDDYDKNNALYEFFRIAQCFVGGVPNPYVLIPLENHINSLRRVENYIRYCENIIHNWDNLNPRKLAKNKGFIKPVIKGNILVSRRKD